MGYDDPPELLQSYVAAWPQHGTVASSFYFYPEPQQASCDSLPMQDLLAEMLRTAEAAAGRERQGGAGAGEVCL